MPRATIRNDETEKYDLKTCPGGYVVLRRMSYGEFLKRRDMVTGMKFRGQTERDFEATMEIANEKVTTYEFQRCVVDHNLEDEEGNKLDFGSASILSVLDPRIGEEIATLIDNLNQFNENLGNFASGYEAPSS